MKIRHSLFAVLMMAASPAFAFDMPPLVDAPEYTGTISGVGGWYIRGDLGYNAALDAGKPKWDDYNRSSSDYSSVESDSARLGEDFALTAGGGYQFNDYLRSDLTLDYFKADFEGTSTKNGRCSAAQLSSTKCGYSHDSSMAALGLLANAYVDLGTVWGITPYVGGGLGATNIDWKSTTTSQRCVGSNCDKGVKYRDETNEGVESWRMTYALMAGFSYDVAAHTKLDFGYRYSQIGAGDMMDYSTNDQKAGAKNAKGKDDGFGRHEIRAGLRFTTW